MADNAKNVPEDAVVDPDKEKKFLNRRGLEHFIIRIAEKVAKKVVSATQSDWEEEDPDSPAYIKNKPEIGPAEINEDTFIFKGDLTTTTNVGKYTPTTEEPMITIPTAGLTFKQAWDDIYNVELDPEVVNPNGTLNISGTDSAEIGTKLNVTISASLNSGSYQYGPATGVTATGYSIKINGTEKSTESSYSCEMIAETSTQPISATINYSDGVIPLTNMNNECPDKQIKAGSITKSANVPAGYRCIFYGFMNTDEGENIHITKEDIKKLQVKNQVKHNTTYPTFMPDPSVSIDKQDSMIVALPSEYSQYLQVTQPSSLNAPVVFDYVEELEIGGVDDYLPIKYDVHVFKPEVMLMENDFKIEIK